MTGHSFELEATRAKAEDKTSAEHSPLLKLQASCNSENQLAKQDAREEKVAPEKLFMDKLNAISLEADRGNKGSQTQAEMAWKKLFQPSGFAEPDVKNQSASLSLDKNIYGSKI